ncbi:porin family protein [Aquimarina addita]|uniref:Porin family protein n=2 Tax=Aquimarina addita TaxID=870485 RepID=A0ABP6UJ76_9FLAO
MIICFVLSSHAQKIDEDPQYARAGFKGGVSYTGITGDLDNAGSRIRVHLGAVVEYPISSTFFIQGELLYSAQGYTVDIENMEQKISLNYLSLPIIAKYYVTEQISIESGPQFSTLSTVRNEDVADNDDFFNSFSNFDFSWGFGAGYKLESGLFFQLRYNLGLSNINDTAVFDVTNRNSIGQLSIGYLFKTKNNRRIIRQEE